jgi:hypothetical protein
MSGFAVGRVARLAEFGEQAAYAVGGALVAVDFTLPAAFFGVIGELALKAEAFTEPRRVPRGGDELGAGQVEVAFARAFLGRRRQWPSSSSVL